VKSVKGIELPINILVIVAVAIIVLLGVIALFYSSWFSGTGPVTAESAKSRACSIANRLGCTDSTGAATQASAIYMTADGLPGGNPLYKTYHNLEEFCLGEYQTTTNCLYLACGMQC
jgi:hypothetical protein